MRISDEHGHKTRILKFLFLLMEQPYRYTKKGLCERLGIGSSTFDRDIEDFKNVGLLPRFDGKYRYGFTANKPYKQLKDLLHFTEEDQQLLVEAIVKIDGYSTRAETLKRKLASLYDYHRLGHVYLRKPYLERLDALQMAIAEKRQVVLKNYRSTNSHLTSDRQVEPFHLNPPEDVVQCWDVDKQMLRFFRMSRFDRVVVTDTPWQSEGKHRIQPADPFRIVDDEQVQVGIRLKVGAYNDLLERYPLTKGYIEQSNDPLWYVFQCDVNHQFIGLTNFLLGNWDSVIVEYPERLREHLEATVRGMRF